MLYTAGGETKAGCCSLSDLKSIQTKYLSQSCTCIPLNTDIPLWQFYIYLAISTISNLQQWYKCFVDFRLGWLILTRFLSSLFNIIPARPILHYSAPISLLHSSICSQENVLLSFYLSGSTSSSVNFLRSPYFGCKRTLLYRWYGYLARLCIGLFEQYAYCWLSSHLTHKTMSYMAIPISIYFTSAVLPEDVFSIQTTRNVWVWCYRHKSM